MADRLGFRFGFVELPEKPENLVVVAPTGSGKTTAVLKRIPLWSTNRRVILTLPTKALMHEVSSRLREMGVKHLVDNSDVRLERKVSTEDWLTSNVIVASYEKVASVLLSYRELARNAVIVVDEIHLATNDDRALAILAILAIAKKYGATVIAMSATIPNVEDLAEYLDAKLIRVDNTVKKVKKFVKVADYTPRGNAFYLKVMLPYVLSYCRDGKRTIVFRPNRRQCETIAKYLRERGVKAEEYHSGVPVDRRRETLRKFEEGEVTVLVATHALAWGVNTSAERVVVAGALQYTPTGPVINLKTTDVVQMAGRAGRPGKCNAVPEVIYLFVDTPPLRVRDENYVITEEEFFRTADAEEYREEIGLKKDADTLTLILRHSGMAKTVSDVIEVSREWFNVPSEKEFREAVLRLECLGLAELDGEEIVLTKYGRALATRMMTVDDFVALKPVIEENPETRIQKLHALAEAIATKMSVKLRVPEEAMYHLSLFEGASESAREVLSQLVAETGDTDAIAETLRNYAGYVYDVTGDLDYLVLSKTARKLRELKYIRTPEWKKLLEMYVDGKIDAFFLNLRRNE